MVFLVLLLITFFSVCFYFLVISGVGKVIYFSYMDDCVHKWTYFEGNTSKVRKCKKCKLKQGYDHYYSKWKSILF